MRVRFASLAALIILAACSENSNNPMSPVEKAPLSAAVVSTIDPAAAPNGTHFQVGNATVSLNGLTATSSSYELAGVGNANATASLSLSFTATVDCTNHGGKLVPVKSQVKSATISSGSLSPENGRLLVPQLTNGGNSPSGQQFLDAAVCPNGNWTKSLAGGSIQLTSFTYTLSFTGFTGAFITITGP